MMGLKGEDEKLVLDAEVKGKGLKEEVHVVRVTSKDYLASSN